MRKKTIKIISTITLLIFILTTANLFALDNPESQGNPENVISQYIDAINNKDYDTMINFQPQSNKTKMKNFINNPYNQNENIGILNIESAKVKEIKQLPDEIVSRLTKLDIYKENFNQITSFLVGIDYKVKRESKYHFNGVNYNLIIVGKENGGWKIIEKSDAPLEMLTLEGYGFDSQDEQIALKILNKRFKGIIVNKEDKTLSQNFSANTELIKDNNNNNNQFESTSSTHTYPDYIAVYHTRDVNDPNYGETVIVDFTFYVENVLPNEWGANWLLESLKAGAIAVKMYGWYHIIHPEVPDYEADITDSVQDQVYIAGTELEETNLAVEAVTGIGIQNTSGNIFLAEYRQGVSGSPGTASCGYISQYGTKYFSEKTTKDYFQMCEYYYNNSSKSTGVISRFYY